MLKIVTGQPRNGKSQYVVSLIYKFIEENQKREEQGKAPRHIYCDINGINDADTVRKLPEVEQFPTYDIWFAPEKPTNDLIELVKPDDFWLPPDASVFIFDECHKIPWIRSDSKALSTHPSCISMNEHGHCDHIVILMTQFPDYIHKHLRGLCQEHYHVKRPKGLKYAVIYKFDEFIVNPRTEKAKKLGETSNFKFRKKYQESYKSASAHDSHKFSFPKKLTFPLVGLAIISILFLNRLSDTYFARFFSSDDVQTQTNTTHTQTTTTQVTHDTLEDAISSIAVTKEQKLIKEVSVKQKYLTKLTNDTAFIEAVRPAMIIESSSECKVYNSVGDRLLLNKSLCKTLSDNPSLIPRFRHVSKDDDTDI